MLQGNWNNALHLALGSRADPSNRDPTDADALRKLLDRATPLYKVGDAAASLAPGTVDKARLEDEGKYVELLFAGDKAGAEEELNHLREAAEYGHARGIEIHVGHGLTYDTVRPVAAIPEVRELNIGHFIMGEALFVGLNAAVKRMRQEIDIARGHA